MPAPQHPGRLARCGNTPSTRTARTRLNTKNESGGACFWAGDGTGPDISYTYDDADRPLTAGAPTGGPAGAAYAYDPLGRQTLIPGADAPDPTRGDITLAYYDDDLVRTIVQAGVSTTYELDALGRRQTSTTSGGGTPADGSTVRHYTDASDNPGWIVDPAGNITRNTPSLAGFGATVTADGTIALAIANPHGDNVTTVKILATQNASTPSLGIEGWSDFDEYGELKVGAITTSSYGYLGQYLRATSPEGAGLTLMGVRVYNAQRGSFTSADPVAGGNETSYNYPNDPVNKSDLDGKWCWKCSLVNGIAMALQWAIGTWGCGVTSALYMLCRGAVGGAVAGAKYLVMQIWALGRPFTWGMLPYAATMAVIGFLDGVTGSFLTYPKLKSVWYSVRTSIYTAARNAGNWLYRHGYYAAANAVFKLPGFILPQLWGRIT